MSSKSGQHHDVRAPGDAKRQVQPASRLPADPTRPRAEPQSRLDPSRTVSSRRLHNVADVAMDAPAVLQRAGQSKLQHPEPYSVISDADAEYTYTLTQNGSNFQIDALTALEDAPIGYVRFTLQNVAQLAAPAPAVHFTGQHVRQRKAGTICHITALMNLTLTRPGPADIYRGFAHILMRLAEQKAKEQGAHLVYLEAAKSDVRVDPNDNTMAPKDPTGFYLRLGYASDPAAALHNARIVESEYQGRISAEQMAVVKLHVNNAFLGGQLTKAL